MDIPTEWIYVVYTYPCISIIMYIPRISMDIHGISFDIVLVYPWYIRGISMDIPRFLNPDFSAGPPVLLVSFNAHTSLCNQSVSFHAPLRLSVLKSHFK